MPMQPMDRGAMMAEALQRGGQPPPEEEGPPTCEKCGMPCPYCSGELPMPEQPPQGGQGGPG